MLLLIDLKSNKTDTLSKENHQFPVFSPSGEFIVTIKAETMFGDHKDQIHLYDFNSEEFINLGVGYHPVWYGGKEIKRSY